MLALAGTVVGMISLREAGRSPTAICDGQRMRPGDICHVYSGANYSSYDYYEAIANSQNSIELSTPIGIVLLSFAGLLAVYSLVTYVRNVAPRRRIIAQGEAPAPTR